MLRGHMKCCHSAVNIFLLKGHTIPYLVRNVWYLVRNMWLPSRCTSHSPSAPYWIACDCFFELLLSFNYNPHDKVFWYLFLCKLSSHYVRLPDCQSGLVLILLWLSIGLLLEAWMSFNIFSELKKCLVNPVRQISTNFFRFYLFKPVFYVFFLHKFIKVAQKGEWCSVGL